jgi:hypothetical protein
MLSLERTLLVLKGVMEMTEAVLVDLLDGSQVLPLPDSILRPFSCVFSSWFRLRYSLFSRSSLSNCSCCRICTSMNSPFASSSNDFRKAMVEFKLDIYSQSY